MPGRPLPGPSFPPVAFTGVVARFATAAIIAATAVILMTPAPAAAHTVTGPRPTNFRTSVTGVGPSVQGLRVQVVDLGNKLELTNRTGRDVTVLGYDGEPYLRVGPRGVFENRRSPATYLNRTRAGTSTVPPEAFHSTPTTPPDWHRVSRGRTAIWHDHRIHWMGVGLPPLVQSAPGRAHEVRRWTVPMLLGTVGVSVHGRLDWVPGPSAWPWVPLTAVLLGLGFAAARSRRRAPAIAAIAVMIVGDAMHTITAEVARPGTQLVKAVQFLGDNFVSVIVWIFAALTIAALVRRRAEALFGLVLVGAMVALVSGLTDLSYLWSSQLPTIGADVLARAEVCSALGLGFGLAGGALLALRRSLPRRPAREAHDPQWVERLVRGLDDGELDAVCSRLDADEVIGLALGDVAARAGTIAAALGNDGLVFVVLAQDEVGSHVWSITSASARSTGSGRLRVQRGAPAPARAQLRTTFPALMQLLAGSRTLDECSASGRLVVIGDRGIVTAIEPYLTVPPAPVGVMP